jgi:phosphoribosylformylglycinamidine synthase
MTPYDVMLSESQERMLVFVQPESEAAVRAIFACFQLHADAVGRVLPEPVFRVRDGGELVADLPLPALVDGALERVLPAQPSAPVPSAPAVEEADLAGVLTRLLGSPALASRLPVFQQYDQQVLNNTVLGPGGDAALLRLKDSRRALAITTDGNARYCQVDPYWGTAMAVAEAARNIVCTGARPLAITNCLNFGTPEDPEVYWQLCQAVAGLAAAARAFELPVVSGNVSLYNETQGRSIPPTPVIGMIGLLDDVERRCAPGLVADGDAVLVLGPPAEHLGGSLYFDRPLGPLPRLDFDLELRTQACVREAIRRRWLRSAHDVAEGGVAVALAEAALLGGIGMRGAFEPTAARFFGEAPSRFVVSCARDDLALLIQLARDHGVACQVLGEVGGARLVLAPAIDVALTDLEATWSRGLS